MLALQHTMREIACKEKTEINWLMKLSPGPRARCPRKPVTHIGPAPLPAASEQHLRLAGVLALQQTYMCGLDLSLCVCVRCVSMPAACEQHLRLAGMLTPAAHHPITLQADFRLHLCL